MRVGKQALLWLLVPLVVVFAGWLLGSYFPIPGVERVAAPVATVAPAPVTTIGMKAGERYHDVHVNRLQLQCQVCHGQSAKNSATYYDPLAQVFNPADRRACLACHKEGSALPFYGEEWQKAKVLP